MRLRSSRWRGLGFGLLMRLRPAAPITGETVTLAATVATFLLLAFLALSSSRQRHHPHHHHQEQQQQHRAMAASRSFVLWLHGLGDSGPNNEPIRSLFTSPEFKTTKWSFPSAPHNPVSCNNGYVMPSWFDIHEIPVTPESPKDESGLLKAVEKVHAMIDKEVAAGIIPENVFICGFSQGGALTLASVLLYPKTLGGGAVFSGWIPFNQSIIMRVTPEAKRTPFLWLHGMADSVVLFKAGQVGPPFLHEAGVNCEFKAYAGLGHSISNDELQNLESWIKSRLKSSS